MRPMTSLRMCLYYLCGIAISIALNCLAIGCASSHGSNPDGSTDSDSDSDSDTDSDTDSDSGTDTDTDTDTDSDTYSDTDTDTDTDADTDTDTETDTCGEVDAGTSEGCVRYVDIDVASSGDGLSWTTAFKTVQEGIDDAYASVDPCGKCQVWIAEGTYYVYVDGPDDTVDVKHGIELYGGFIGTELSLDERDWETNATVLDGHEFDASVNRVFHVVSTHGMNVVDGISVTGGQANSWELAR